MVLLNILCLVNWIVICSAAASEDDVGLAVSLSPSYFYYGGMDVFQGRVDTYTSDNYYSPRYKSFYDDTDIISMRSDPDNSAMIFIDSMTQSVRRIRNFNSWLNDTTMDHVNYTIHEGLSDTLHARIAYDWLTGNVYWTDNKLNWIAVQNAYNGDQSSYLILIHEGVIAPAAIAVDPIHRYLFWAEHGADRTVIVRSDLTGKNQKVIVKGLDWVPDMVTDPADNKLYWIDNNRNAIERSDYSGDNRKIVYRSTNILLTITSITIYKDVLCVIEYADEFVACVHKNNGVQTWADYIYNGYPFALDMYSTETRPQQTHACFNYGCQDICINTDNGAKCFCGEGYELDLDNKTCKASHSLYGKSLLIAYMNDICMFDLRVITSYKGNETCFFHWNTTIGLVTVDANALKLYFEDSSTRSIIQLNLKTMENTSWVATGQVSGLQFDLIGGDLYWTESDTGTLRVSNTLERNRLATLKSGLVNPRALTVYPHEYLLFWISGNSDSSTIHSYLLDNSNTVKVVLDHASLKNPMALFYHDIHNRLYYIDGGKLHSVEKDGSDKKTYQSVGSDEVLLMYKDFSLTSSGSDDITTVNVYQTPNFPKHSISVTGGDFMSMCLFDKGSQRKEKNGCEFKNGGCQHVCIPETKNGHRCECSFGYVLAGDSKTCTVNPKKTNFALAVDFTHGEIYQVDLNNGSNVNAIDIPRPAKPLAAIFDDKEHIYWVDYNSDKFHRSTLTGGMTSTIYTMDEYLCFSLAMDPSTGNIYYAALPYGSKYTSYIGVIHPEKSKHKTLVEDIRVAASIALYPKKGLMYWIDQDFYLSYGSISRASMDGTNIEIIIATGLSQPNSIAIDYTGNMIYWADFYEDRIYSANLDGSNKNAIYTDSGANIAHLAVAGGYVYYTATKNELVKKIDKSTGRAVSWMNNAPEMGRLESLDVYTTKPIDAHPYCSQNNGLCSTFCFPKDGHLISCGCEDGVDLLADMRTCKGVLKCEQTIPNGKFEETCMPYDNKLCGYSCDEGYSKTAGAFGTYRFGSNTLLEDVKLNCSKHPNVPNKLSWDRDLKSLCRKIVTPVSTIPPPKPTTTTTPRPTTTPTTQVPTKEPGVALGQKQAETQTDGVTMGTFVGVLFAVIILFILIILGLAFVVYRRRGSEMFSHAKFVNSPNVPHLTDVHTGRENAYEHIDEKVADAQNASNAAGAPTAGMENPLYKATTTSSPEAMNQNTYTSIDISKF